MALVFIFDYTSIEAFSSRPGENRKLMKDDDPSPSDSNVPEKKYKLLWVSPGLERYGVASLVLGLATAMKHQGHEVRIIALGDGYLVDRCEELGFTCHQIDCQPFSQFSGSLLNRAMAVGKVGVETKRAIKASLAALADWKPNVIHCARPNMISFTGQLASRLAAKPIWEMPNLINRTLPFDIAWRYYNHLCTKYGFTVLADSEFTGKTLESRNVKPITFYHAVDDTRFDPSQVDPVQRSQLDLDEGHIVTGILARICRSKGQHLLVDAAMKLAERFPQLRYVLIGGATDDDFLPNLKSTIERNNKRDLFRFLEPVKDVERYYSLFDFTINCRIEPEPFGLSVIESMLMKMPVLVHALGGPSESVLDGETGWHIQEATVDALSNGIERALADQSKWIAMGEFSRQHAVEKFGTAVSVSRYLNALNME